jgi:hypothetical protein
MAACLLFGTNAPTPDLVRSLLEDCGDDPQDALKAVLTMLVAIEGQLARIAEALEAR